MIEKTDRLSLLKKNVDQRRPISKGLIRSLKEDFLIKNTYHSNAIEGNRLSIYETKAVLQWLKEKQAEEDARPINEKEIAIGRIKGFAFLNLHPSKAQYLTDNQS